MRRQRFAVIGAGLAAIFLSVAAGDAQQLPMEPLHDTGQSVTGAYEGWFKNPDDTFSLLLGYYNRNLEQVFDIPVGPNNRIEPGGPDQGQPTHFLPGRMWGIFTIVVPKDFGDKQLSWTLVANGKTTVIPISLDPLMEVSPFVDGTGNTPPFIGFDEAGPFVQGPKGQTTSATAELQNPLILAVWIADDAKLPPEGGTRRRGPAVTVRWSKFRGPGNVTFAKDRPAVEPAEFKAPPNTAFSGKATTTATFDQPGEYVVRIVANDSTGDGGRGFQCCWSNAYVKVSVKAGAGQAAGGQ